MLSGEVGTGKTTLLRSLMDSLHRIGWPFAFIFNPTLTPNELVEYVVADLGVPNVNTKSKSAMLFALNNWLLKLHTDGKTAILIVDEAHALSNATFEEIRFLSNLETSDAKLIQVILAGQPELEQRLDEPQLRQIKQRLFQRCTLSAMTKDETAAYIGRRLTLAGANGEPIFTKEAVAAAHRFSGGIPRIINTLCEHALVNGYARGKKPLQDFDIEEIAVEFGFADSAREAELQPHLVGER
jgi:general secretion pathway protein A